jgi:peptidoglycan/LPS O-acetylase OafA/YrhL
MMTAVRQIPSLDGLRAVAVMIVFVAHAGLSDLIPGNLGVTIFFFLSGFLITTLLRVEYENSAKIDLLAFYARRAIRILPPMYIILAAATLLTIAGVLGGTISPQALLAQVLHWSNYYVISNGWWEGRAPGTWIFWSLAVEEHFYLVFPLLYVVLRRFVPTARRQALCLLGICAGVLLWRFALVYALGAYKEQTYIATDARIDSILFGCVLAIAANPVLDRIPLPRWVWTYALFPAGIVAIVLSYVVRDPGFEQTLRYTVQGIALVPIFVTCIRESQTGVFRALNWRPLMFLGVISYTIYLVHPIVLFAVAEWTQWPGLAQAVIALAFTLGIAIGMHLLVERPLGRLRRRLSRVPTGPAGGTDAVATVRDRRAPSEGVAVPAVALTHLPSELLDSLRGLAAFYVLLTHARLFLFASAGTIVALDGDILLRATAYVLGLTRYGHAAVILFFLVSGYAIHFRQAHRLAAGTAAMDSWRDYAVRRLRRIYPPLIAAVALTVLFAEVGSRINPAFYSHAAQNPDFGYIGMPTAAEVIGTLAFVQDFVTPQLMSNGALWSLAFEGFFYVTYPLTLFLSIRLGPSRSLGLFAAAGAAAAIASGAGVDFGPLRLIAYWPAWVAGAFIADARAGRVVVPRWLWQATALGGASLALALTLGLAATGQGANESRWDILWTIAAFGPLGWIAAARHGDRTQGLVTRALGPFRALGAMSYSLYVVHFPVVAFLSAVWLSRTDAMPRSLWLYFIGIGCALALAYVVYRVAERPFVARRYRNRAASAHERGGEFDGVAAVGLRARRAG